MYKVLPITDKHWDDWSRKAKKYYKLSIINRKHHSYKPNTTHIKLRLKHVCLTSYVSKVEPIDNL